VTQPQLYTKTSEDSYFKELDAVVSDHWLLVGEKEYDLSAVSSSEVISEPSERDWPKFFIKLLGYLTIGAVVWAVISYFNWNNWNNAGLIPAFLVAVMAVKDICCPHHHRPLTPHSHSSNQVSQPGGYD
jgi:hypothetical protein